MTTMMTVTTKTHSELHKGGGGKGPEDDDLFCLTRKSPMKGLRVFVTVMLIRPSHQYALIIRVSNYLSLVL